MPKLTPEFKQILFRFLIFSALFIIASGITGSWVVSNRLLYGFNFFIYGNLGKLVIFSVIVFLFLTRGRLKDLRYKRYDARNLVFILCALLLVWTFFPLARILLTYQSFTSNLPLSLLVHLNLVLIPVFLLLGVFGYSFLKTFIREFKKELAICVGLSSVLFLAIFQVWKLWPLFSRLVLNAEYFLFSHIYTSVYVIPPRSLFVQSFAVEIAEACSGLESIFLFTVLYIFITIIDWKKLDTRKILLFYPLLLAGLVVVNILRVFLLILIGVLINPQIMVTLFHTYLGMVLFVIYFLVFLIFGYKRVKKKISS